MYAFAKQYNCQQVLAYLLVPGLYRLIKSCKARRIYVDRHVDRHVVNAEIKISVIEWVYY